MKTEEGNNTVEQNKLISEFDGWKRLKYHSSWECLMPVVEKLNNSGFAIHIDESCVFLHFPDTELPLLRFDYDQHEGMKNTVYKAVTKAIEWYNSQIAINSKKEKEKEI